MNGFIFRVCAYHGEPVTIGSVPTRPGLSHDTPLAFDRVVNDPNNDTIRDVVHGPSGYDIGQLLGDFENEYQCKIGTDESTTGGTQVFEFDVFEPSWPNDDEAKDVIDDLTERLVDWAEGYPTGR